MSQLINAEWLAKQVEGKHGIQTALADHIGIDRTKVNKMVKGSREITQVEAQKIQEFFTNQSVEKSAQSDDEIRTEIAARLKEARVAAGFSDIKSAAVATGVHAMKYRHHENGTRDLMSTDVIKYAKVFKFSLDWLYTGKSGPHNACDAATLPVDAGRSITAIVKAFDPELMILTLSKQEYEIVKEAADIFVRLNGSDPKRSKDAEVLSNIFLTEDREVTEAQVTERP